MWRGSVLPPGRLPSGPSGLRVVSLAIRFRAGRRERLLARWIESVPWHARRKLPNHLKPIKPPRRPIMRLGNSRRWRAWPAGTMSSQAQSLSAYGGTCTSRAALRRRPRIRRPCPPTTRGRLLIGCEAASDEWAAIMSTLLVALGLSIAAVFGVGFAAGSFMRAMVARRNRRRREGWARQSIQHVQSIQHRMKPPQPASSSTTIPSLPEVADAPPSTPH
jgi:hypothetical protein